MSFVYVTPGAEVYHDPQYSSVHSVGVREITTDIVQFNRADAVIDNLFRQYQPTFLGICMDTRKLPVVDGMCQVSDRYEVADIVIGPTTTPFISVQVASGCTRLDKQRRRYRLNYTFPDVSVATNEPINACLLKFELLSPKPAIGYWCLGFHQKRTAVRTVIGFVSLPALMSNTPEVMVWWPDLHIRLGYEVSSMSYIFARNERWLLVAFLDQPPKTESKEKEMKAMPNSSEEQQERGAIKHLAESLAQTEPMTMAI